MAAENLDALPAGPDHAGRQAGFDVFYRDHIRDLLRYAIYLRTDPHQAQDVCQDVMADILQNWEDIDRPTSYARTAVLNKIRKLHRHPPGRLSLDLARKGGLPAEAAEDPALSVWEDQQSLAQLLSHLTERQRQVMTLICAGLTPTEIGERLGITASAVSKHIQAARAHLRPRPAVAIPRQSIPTSHALISDPEVTS